MGVFTNRQRGEAFLMGELIDLAAFREQKEKERQETDSQRMNDIMQMLEDFFTNNPVSTGPVYISLDHLTDYYDNEE